MTDEQLMSLEVRALESRDYGEYYCFVTPREVLELIDYIRELQRSNDNAK